MWSVPPAESPGGGLSDRDGWEGGDSGGDPDSCTCFCGGTGDRPGVGLGSEGTAGSDIGGKSAGERDDEESSVNAGDCSDEETGGEAGASTGHSCVHSGVCVGGDTSGPWPPLSFSLGSHCVGSCVDSSRWACSAWRLGLLCSGHSLPRASSIWQYTSTLGKITLLEGELR